MKQTEKFQDFAEPDSRPVTPSLPAFSSLLASKVTVSCPLDNLAPATSFRGRLFEQKVDISNPNPEFCRI